MALLIKPSAKKKKKHTCKGYKESHAMPTHASDDGSFYPRPNCGRS
jgi:hypothetical protein